MDDVEYGNLKLWELILIKNNMLCFIANICIYTKYPVHL
jgi:hypothetical protein